MNLQDLFKDNFNKQGVAEGLTYPQKHSSWTVMSPKRSEFNTPYKLDQEKEARAHAERIGGKLVKVDQHGHAIRAQKGVAETALNPKSPVADLEAKRKALQDLERQPGADLAAIRQRKLELEKEARAKGLVKSNAIAESYNRLKNRT